VPNETLECNLPSCRPVRFSMLITCSAIYKQLWCSTRKTLWCITVGTSKNCMSKTDHVQEHTDRTGTNLWNCKYENGLAGSICLISVALLVNINIRKLFSCNMYLHNWVNTCSYNFSISIILCQYRELIISSYNRPVKSVNTSYFAWNYVVMDCYDTLIWVVLC